MQTKRAAAGLVLAAFLSCSCSGFAAAVCARETDIRDALHDAADYLGPIGHVVDRVLALGLELFCSTVQVTVGATDGAARLVGIIGPAEPVSVPETPPEGGA